MSQLLAGLLRWLVARHSDQEGFAQEGQCAAAEQLLVFRFHVAHFPADETGSILYYSPREKGCRPKRKSTMRSKEID